MSEISHVEGAFRGSPRVFIATPTYTGKLDSNYMFSLLYTIPRLNEAGIGFDHYVMSYNCHVDDSRNSIIRDFLLTDCTELIFIDADVSWEPEALMKLIQHDRDVVAGVYPKRSDRDLDFPVRVEPGTVLQADKDGLVEVSGAPTGFMKIKRHVIEKMVEANKHRRFMGREAKSGDVPYTIVFERTYEDGFRWSGDYNFCRQWQKMGGKVYVDPEMHLTHVGEVRFSGKLGDFWRDKHGVTQMLLERNFNKAIENLKSGKCAENDFVALTKGWGNPFAADFELLATCYWVAKEAKGPIFEAGSGLSTIVMALANPDVEVHCMEHEIVWASRLKYFLDIYGVKNVTVHFNDLKEYEDGKWYDSSSLPKVKFDVAVCDGPPRRISNRSIFYRLLDEQIKDAIVLMDDADNDQAIEPIERWAKRYNREVKILGQSRRFAMSNRAKEVTKVSGAKSHLGAECQRLEI